MDPSRRVRYDLRSRDRSPRMITRLSTANRSYRSLRDGSGFAAFLAMNRQATIIQSLRDKGASRLNSPIRLNLAPSILIRLMYVFLSLPRRRVFIRRF
jgi:hypothetical protein